MKVNRCLVLAMACGLVGCRADLGTEQHIAQSIKAECHDTWPCQISLRRSTPFQWDELYVFKFTASKAEIEKTIHTTISNYNELTRYLVFTSDGRAVRIESEPTDVEHPIKDELVFEMPDSVSYRTFAAGTTFAVTREQRDTGAYYMLKPQ
jgi:hypothetical protein